MDHTSGEKNQTSAARINSATGKRAAGLSR